MMFFLFFGALHDTLKTVAANSFFGSHIFIFSLIGLLSLVTVMVIKKYLKTGHVLFPFAACLVIILFLWELLHLGSNIVLERANDNNLARGDLDYKFGRTGNAEKPDIFFIVFDSYTSSTCLLNDFQYSNELDSLLIKKGFFIARNSRSNYPLTPFSIASILNMGYLREVPMDAKATAKAMLQGASSVYESKLPAILHGEGYRIYNYSPFDIRNHSAINLDYFGPLSKRLIDEQTLLGRFSTHLFWNFTVKNFWTGKIHVPKSYPKYRETYIQDYITGNVEGLMSVANHEDSVPRFVYCHIMLPHEPYYFKADGSFQPDSLLFDKSNPKGKFLAQTIYTNDIIKQIVDQLIRQRKRPYAVILQGDHGFRDFDNKSEKDKIFEILNAYYFSDNQYNSVYNSITPVNSFRAVLNKYFKQDFSLLKDSSIYIKDPSFNFEKVN
jgi:hypothetical protein